MKVLHVTPAFFPATHWGGPIHSLHGLCNALVEHERVDLRVLTTDTAGPRRTQKVDVSSTPMRYPAGYDVYFERRRWGPSFAPALFRALPSMIRWADVVHLTAVYSSPTLPTLALCRLLGRPVVWSPRGSLQRWSGTRNRGVKRLWEISAREVLDPSRTVLHCTSEDEARSSRERIRGIDAVIVPNGVDVPPTARVARTRSGPLRILYLGRIDPIKALDQLILALSLVGADVATLTIAGGGEPEVLRQLRELTIGRGVENRVQFVGHVEGREKENLFFEHDILALVSHRENFGMVIVEALSRGLPVITSTGTPWREVEKRGCGLSVTNDPSSLAHAITSMSSAHLTNMGAAGRAWMVSDFSWSAIAEKMLAIYGNLVSRAVTAVP